MSHGDPDVPTTKLDEGWELTSRERTRLLSLPTMTVWGNTLVYEDVALQHQLNASHPWRLFFATRLSFMPPLAPGVGPAMLLPTVWPAVKDGFRTDMRDRGVDISIRGQDERIRVDSGERALLVRFEATEQAHGDGPPQLRGFLACWPRLTDFRVAGGLFPVHSLEVNIEGDSTTPRADEQRLLSLIKVVR